MGYAKLLDINLNEIKFNEPRIVEISPEAAQKLIDKSEENARNGGFLNRRLNMEHVSDLASEMSNGRWIWNNGDVIRLTWGGSVCDGNHRLHAIIKSGVTIQSLIMKVSDKSIETIDRCRRRSDTDDAYIKRLLYKNITSVVTAVRMLYLFDKGYDLFTQIMKRQVRVNTRDSGFEQAIRNYSYLQEIKVGKYEKYITKSGVLFVYAIAKDMHNEERYKVFLNDIETGEDLKKGNPALAYRNYISSGIDYKNVWNNKSLKLYAFIKAWQAYNKDKKLIRIQIPKEGLSVSKGLWHIKV